MTSRAGRGDFDLNYFQTHNEGLDEAKASEVPRWRSVVGFHSPDVVVVADGGGLVAAARTRSAPSIG